MTVGTSQPVIQIPTTPKNKTWIFIYYLSLCILQLVYLSPIEFSHVPMFHPFKPHCIASHLRSGCITPSSSSSCSPLCYLTATAPHRVPEPLASACNSLFSRKPEQASSNSRPIQALQPFFRICAQDFQVPSRTQLIDSKKHRADEVTRLSIPIKARKQDFIPSAWCVGREKLRTCPTLCF